LKSDNLLEDILALDKIILFILFMYKKLKLVDIIFTINLHIS